jgi:hypothetical protein
VASGRIMADRGFVSIEEPGCDTTFPSVQIWQPVLAGEEGVPPGLFAVPYWQGR